MATLPTRLQQQACDHLAEALYRVTEASRLDGKGRLGQAELETLAGLIARVSTAFTLDQIVARALERRGKALGLSPGRSELLTLLDVDVKPLAMLSLSDDELNELLARIDEELGNP
jgi:hypothetical protein